MWRGGGGRGARVGRGRAVAPERADLQRCDHPVPEPERRLGPGVPGWPAARAPDQSTSPSSCSSRTTATTRRSRSPTTSRSRTPAAASTSRWASPYALELRRRRAGRGCSRIRHDRRRRADPGAMLLFLVDDDVTEERPLELEIESSEGTGIVELDIERTPVDGTLSQFSLRLALVAAAVPRSRVLTGLFSEPVRYGCLGIVVATLRDRRRTATPGRRLVDPPRRGSGALGRRRRSGGAERHRRRPVRGRRWRPGGDRGDHRLPAREA